MAKLYGAENVYDFSLGNPNVPAPESVKNAIIESGKRRMIQSFFMDTPTATAGYEDVRAAVAESLNRRFRNEFRCAKYC